MTFLFMYALIRILEFFRTSSVLNIFMMSSTVGRFLQGHKLDIRHATSPLDVLWLTCGVRIAFFDAKGANFFFFSVS